MKIYGLLLVLANGVLGCADDKSFTISVENKSNADIKNVQVEFLKSDFTFSFGGLKTDIKAGHADIKVDKKPKTVRLSWMQEEKKLSAKVKIPEDIRKKIHGNREELILRIDKKLPIRVYVKIRNRLKPGKPTIYPPEFGRVDK